MNHAFLTYTAGFTLGLFVQVGLIAHLVSLLAPALGGQGSGLAAGFATACAIVDRLFVGWLLPPQGDRRVAAALTYVVQALGCLAFMLSGGETISLLLLGVGLFGVGIGNVTSLPPLIAQVEFAELDVPRVIALSTGIAQAAFAFAPAAFGLLREWQTASELHIVLFFGIAATLQIIAAMCYLRGRSA
uniref:Transport protein n=1 Tax=Candidatus Entotheonella serta TaxID=1652106 RepID=A0A2P1AM97_9BACT|nr:transport protein [Candidatus Entotheonella serta]